MEHNTLIAIRYVLFAVMLSIALFFSPNSDVTLLAGLLSGIMLPSTHLLPTIAVTKNKK